MVSENQPFTTETPPVQSNKRKRAINESPENRLEELVSKPLDVCGHCNKKCKDKGPLSEAIQCDLCGHWVHTSCEGLTKKQYDSFTQLAVAVDGLSYLLLQTEIMCIKTKEYNSTVSPDFFRYIQRSF